MSYTLKNLAHNQQGNMQVAQAAFNIENVLRDIVPMESWHESYMAAIYALYKINHNPELKSLSWQQFMETEFSGNDLISQFMKEYVSDAVFDSIRSLMEKYDSEVLASIICSDDIFRGKNPEEMPTPASIIRLVQALLDIQPKDKVADICCGRGSFLLASSIAYPAADYTGYDTQVIYIAMAKIRAEVMGYPIHFYRKDAFALGTEKDVEKFDKIFAHIPFSFRVFNSLSCQKYIQKFKTEWPKISRVMTAEWFFGNLVCDLLSQTGKAAILMPNRSMTNNKDLEMRKYLIDKGFVESVISLPERMLYGTGISSSLVILSHDNKAVRMIDASNFHHSNRRTNEFHDEDIQIILDSRITDNEYSKSVSLEEIKENQYNLSPKQYHDLLIDPDYIELGHVILNITRGAHCSAKQLDEMASTTPTSMYYLMLSNIQDGMISDLPYLSDIAPQYRKYCLKSNSFLLSKNGFPYKMAVAADLKDEKVLVTGNFYIIELDESKINPFYLQAFLESDLGTALLKKYSSGDIISMISLDQLKKLPVPLPPMEEQKRVAIRYRAALDEIAIAKIRLEKARNRMHQIWQEEEA